MKPLPILTEHQLKKFWSKIQVGEPQDCWEWQGQLSKHGYGRFSIQSKDYIAHRLVYFLHTETDPQSSQVIQTCGVRNCCNPQHLRLSVHRMIKLGEPQVCYIREQYAKGVSLRTLARRYSVGVATIHRIVTRQTWKDI